jgi:hypothetical protein
MEEIKKNQTGSTKRLYSIKELTSEIGGTTWFWRSLIWDRKLPFIQVGKKMFVDRNDVESFINENKRWN